MIVRPKKTLASLLLIASALAGCTSFYEIPVETPVSPKLDISAFQRVFVAGFVAGNNEDVDGNLETVRLLRSQLRQKGTLRVVEAEALPLQQVAVEQGLVPAATREETPAPAAVVEAPRTADSPATAQAVVNEEQSLEAAEKIFEDKDYWKKVGEEHQAPLIVTGTVLFRPQTSAGFVQREREVYDEFGRRSVDPQRVYMERTGFVLRPTFVFIDGRSGEVLHTETFNEEILYDQNRQTPALSSFFELMDRLLPSFLNTMTAQKIRGTRVLLK